MSGEDLLRALFNEDVRALLRVAANELDRAYVEQWVALLGLDVQWRAVTP